MSATKYFHAGNATRPYRVGSNLIKFELSGRNGTVWEGILETDDQEVIAGLKTIEEEGHSGIREISKEVYDDLKKKAVSLKSDQAVRLMPSPAFAQPNQRGNAVHAAVENAPDQQPQPAPEKTIDELIKADKVKAKDGDDKIPSK